MKKKAFTLIELLVVIAIIGILATISVIALSNARAKSRDAKRVADIKQMSTALELFFNDKGYYPPEEMLNSTSSPVYLGSIYSTSTNGTTTYMQIIPTAPTPADGECLDSENTYTYLRSQDGGSYRLDFCLGGRVGTISGGLMSATPAGFVALAQGQFLDEAMDGVGVTYLHNGLTFEMNTNNGGYFYVMATASSSSSMVPVGRGQRELIIGDRAVFHVGGVQLGDPLDLGLKYAGDDSGMLKVYPTTLTGDEDTITMDTVYITRFLQSLKTMRDGRVRIEGHTDVRDYANANGITTLSGANFSDLVAATGRDLVSEEDAKAVLIDTLSDSSIAVKDHSIK